MEGSGRKWKRRVPKRCSLLLQLDPRYRPRGQWSEKYHSSNGRFLPSGAGSPFLLSATGLGIPHGYPPRRALTLGATPPSMLVPAASGSKPGLRERESPVQQEKRKVPRIGIKTHPSEKVPPNGNSILEKAAPYQGVFLLVPMRRTETVEHSFSLLSQHGFFLKIAEKAHTMRLLTCAGGL